ncbi:hypothetical protein KUBF_30020 [Bacteroides finegoldii]|nr:hypothetical protein KUBF_30020 [Bacteroides finegoldii]
MRLNKLPLNVIGLNRVGLNQIGSPSHRANTSDRPYIDPEVLASLVAVCICDGKSNDDPDRAVIKNLVDPDNPFIISNAAYKLNSGYGKYEEDFTTWYGATGVLQTSSKIEITDGFKHNWVINKRSGDATINSSKVLIKGIPESGYLQYRYFESEDATKKTSIDIYEDGEYSLPNSTLNNLNDLVGFQLFSKIPPLDSQSFVGLTITQIPSHQGAFVTDGKDDLITSTKTVQEMLGGSNEVTVVSMMLNLENEKITYTNQIRPFQNGYIRNNVISNTGGKYGIYGYKITDISDIFKTTIGINDILGDRKDCSRDVGGTTRIDGKFSVEGYCFNDGTIGEVSQVAWYWTIISKIALTTDQINQVISYFNLDKHVKPDIIYDTIRQGITNENHASFNDELVDFSGNGHNMKIYNSAWKLGSGIGKYEEDFTSWLIGTNINVTNDTIKAVGIVSSYVSTKVTPNSEIAPFTIKVTGIPKNGEIRYYYCSSSTKIDSFYIREDGQYNVPQSERWELTGSYRVGFTISNPSLDWSRLVIEQIPDYEGALVSDGVSDYGKVENLPIYKDYTVVADREIIDGLAENADGGVAVRGTSISNGAFGFDYKNEVYSFATPNSKVIDVERFISYQSKYVNNGTNINAGNIVDANPLTIGKLGSSTDRYSKLALWSFLLFPYSLSEFLLERQLKRYKLGTLYPDMVEFRPIVKSNREYSSISYSVNPGEYISVDSMVTITVTLSNTSDKLIDVSCNAISDISISGDNGVYKITGKVVKSPQKINIVISSYLTMLNNDTLISNETLIKNE